MRARDHDGSRRTQWMRKDHFPALPRITTPCRSRAYRDRREGRPELWCRARRRFWLSGGENQRLALARAIYKQTRVLFVNEPTASLDAANRRMVIELFVDFAASGCTVIVSTHDTELINACGRDTRSVPPGQPAPSINDHTTGTPSLPWR